MSSKCGGRQLKMVLMLPTQKNKIPIAASGDQPFFVSLGTRWRVLLLPLIQYDKTFKDRNSWKSNNGDVNGQNTLCIFANLNAHAKIHPGSICKSSVSGILEILRYYCPLSKWQDLIHSLICMSVHLCFHWVIWASQQIAQIVWLNLKITLLFFCPSQQQGLIVSEPSLDKQFAFM